LSNAEPFLPELKQASIGKGKELLGTRILAFAEKEKP
jgi:hypothetical protein